MFPRWLTYCRSCRICIPQATATPVSYTHLLLFQYRLLGQDGVDFVVEVFDHDFGFKIDLIIVLRAAAILLLLPVLAHHDERRLNGRDAGENQIEQDERIRIKRL